MMAHLSLLELLIMVILLPGLLKTLFADMPPKPDITYREDLVGIAMAFLYNTKLINNLKSLTRSKFYKWESQNIIISAEALWWNILTFGKVSWTDSEDGSILKTIIKPLTSISWSQFGMYSNNFTIKALFIEEERLCLIQMVALLSYPISKFSKTISK